jgi:hypothetical protein
MNAIGNTHARFKQAGVGTNGILKCKFLTKNAHRTVAETVAEQPGGCVELVPVELKNLTPVNPCPPNVRAAAR